MNRIKNNCANIITIIFDDVINLTDEFKKKIFKKLISEYRHYKINFIFSVQYIKWINHVFRECCNYAIFFKTTNKMSLEAIYENFMQDKNNVKNVKIPFYLWDLWEIPSERREVPI